MKEYWNDVFIPFLESYQTGIFTPNPDVFCNKFVKFHYFKKYMYDNYNIKYVATGHYCRVQYSNNNDDEDVERVDHYNNNSNNNCSRKGFTDNVSHFFDDNNNNIQHHHKVYLLKGVDNYKDQSYFLSFTTVRCNDYYKDLVYMYYSTLIDENLFQLFF